MTVSAEGNAANEAEDFATRLVVSLKVVCSASVTLGARCFATDAVKRVFAHGGDGTAR